MGIWGVSIGDTKWIYLMSNTSLTASINIQGTCQIYGYSPRAINVSSGAFFTCTGDQNFINIHFVDLQDSPGDSNALIVLSGNSLKIENVTFNRLPTAQYNYRGLVDVINGNIEWRNHMDNFKLQGCELIKMSNEAQFTISSGYACRIGSANDGIQLSNSRIIAGAFHRTLQFMNSNFTNIVNTGNGGSVLYLRVDTGGQINIEGCIFGSCSCAQPGNGGALAVILNSGTARLKIYNTLFVNCSTAAGYGGYGWGGAIFINMLYAFNPAYFNLTLLTFTDCFSAVEAGNHVHIQSAETQSLGATLLSSNIFSVKDTTVQNLDQKLNYMGIDTGNVAGGSNDPFRHCPLFLECYKLYLFKDPYNVSQNSGSNDNEDCGRESDPCQNVKYITDFTGSEHVKYSQSSSIVNIVMLSDSTMEDTLDINPSKYVGQLITMKSKDYFNDSQSTSKKYIQTQLRSTYYISVTSTSRLELYGLQFNNLLSSAGGSLIFASTSSTTSYIIKIVSCKFVFAGSSLAHQIIYINGGKILIQKTAFKNYQFSDTNTAIVIQSISLSSIAELEQDNFTDITQSGTGSGAAISTVLNSG
ncbi:MAG: hypothetical protein EZS28_028490, partial [Streblomastix strix]